MTTLIKIAIKAAIEAGEAIMKIYSDPNADFGVEIKSDSSPLTIADKKSNEVIVSHLKDCGIPILSEEIKQAPYSQRKDWNRLWVIDPLDGTKEFIKRNGEFTVNIALVEDGSPILGVIYVPVTGELYYGDSESGAYKEVDGNKTKLPIKQDRTGYMVVASRSHLSPQTESFIAELGKSHPEIEMVSKGSSLKICLIAEGAADIYPRYAPTMEWDTAAGDAILRAAGGTMRHAYEQYPLRYNKEDLLNPHFIAE